MLTLAFALLWEDVSTCFKLQLDVKQDFFFFGAFQNFLQWLLRICKVEKCMFN